MGVIISSGGIGCNVLTAVRLRLTNFSIQVSQQTLQSREREMAAIKVAWYTVHTLEELKKSQPNKYYRKGRHKVPHLLSV